MLYVASGSNGNGQILAFNIDPNTGALGAPTAFSGPAYASQLKIHPSGNFMYLSDFDIGAVDGYSISPADGSLTQVNGSPFLFPTTPPSKNGGPLAITPNGKFVLFADSMGDIGTFTVGSTGALTFNNSDVVDADQPIDFAIDPSNSFVYVADHFDPMTGGFSVYSIDPIVGALNPVSGSPFSFTQNSGPLGIAIHPSGKFLYSALSNASGVAALNIGSGGALTAIQGSPYTTNFIPESVVLHPSGKFLYVGCHGQGLILAYKIDATTGALTSMASYNGGDPQHLAIDPSGNFLYAPNTIGRQIDAYRINPSAGTLTYIGTFPAGDDPGAVAILQLP